MDDDIVLSAVVDDYKAIVEFIRDQLYEEQVRDDYKELLTLSLVFLGSPEANSVHINSSAYHRAGWITKVIYCLNICLLGQQFNFLSTSLKLSEKHICGENIDQIYI